MRRRCRDRVALSVSRAVVLYVARPVLRTETMRDRRRLMLLGTLVGALLLASCGAVAPLPPPVILLIGALMVASLGGLAAGCRGNRGAVDKNADDAGDAGDPGGDAGDARSDPYPGCGLGSRPLSAQAPPGWFRCCLGTEVRLCPPVPPNVACNYGLGQTFCSDGLTCGLTRDNPCGAPDGGVDAAAADAAADASADGTIAGDATVPADATSSDAFPGCGEGSRPLGAEVPSGWFRCCLGTEVRLCPSTPPTVACNYGLGQTFCSDGVTCGFTGNNPCGTDAGVDTGAAETGP
jgi:hypothetical protein